MKRGTTVGSGLCTELAEAVVVGFGDSTVDWLLSLYKFILAC